MGNLGNKTGAIQFLLQGFSWHGAANTAEPSAGCLEISATKEASWDPWDGPQNLSEIHMERNFGKLRAMSSSGDMTARQYWAFAATLSRKQLNALKKAKLGKKSLGNVPHLTEEELFGSIWIVWSTFFIFSRICLDLFGRGLVFDFEIF